MSIIWLWGGLRTAVFFSISMTHTCIISNTAHTNTRVPSKTYDYAGCSGTFGAFSVQPTISYCIAFHSYSDPRIQPKSYGRNMRHAQCVPHNNICTVAREAGLKNGLGEWMNVWIWIERTNVGNAFALRHSMDRYHRFMCMRTADRQLRSYLLKQFTPKLNGFALLETNFTDWMVEYGSQADRARMLCERLRSLHLNGESCFFSQISRAVQKYAESLLFPQGKCEIKMSHRLKALKLVETMRRVPWTAICESYRIQACIGTVNFKNTSR